MSTEAQEAKQTLEAQAQEVAKDLSITASEGKKEEAIVPGDKEAKANEPQDEPPIPVTPDSYE